MDYEELIDLLFEEFQSEIMIEGDHTNPEVFRYRYYDLPAFLDVLNFNQGVVFIGWGIQQIVNLENETITLD